MKKIIILSDGSTLNVNSYYYKNIIKPKDYLNNSLWLKEKDSDISFDNKFLWLKKKYNYNFMKYLAVKDKKT